MIGRLRLDPQTQLALQVFLGVASVVFMIRMRSSSHTLTTEVAPNLPLVLADRARIQQVLGNLGDNAMKYSPNGGRVTISARFSENEAIVSVQDEGIGIPEGQLEAVFDRFHRGADARVRTVRGVGLGLPICRGIIQAHGGGSGPNRRFWGEPWCRLRCHWIQRTFGPARKYVCRIHAQCEIGSAHQVQ